MMVSVAVLASGRGTNLEALLDAQEDGDLDPARIEGVFSDNEDARALAIAHERGVEAQFVDPDGLDRAAYAEALLEALDANDPDVVVLAGFMRILTPSFIQAYPDRILNIHPSLLPQFRGLDAQRRALEAGVRIAGATTHIVREDVDAGPIVLQAAVPVHPEDDVERLSDRILAAEHRILPASVRLFAEGRLSVGQDTVSIKGDLKITDTTLIVPEVTS